MALVDDNKAEQMLFDENLLSNYLYFLYKRPLDKIYEKNCQEIANEFIFYFKRNEYVIRGKTKCDYSLIFSSQNENSLTILLISNVKLINSN